mgnify:CR=1 FL=1
MHLLIYCSNSLRGDQEMLLSELAEKELIQVKEGIRYGLLADTDLLFEAETGKLIGLEIKQRTGLLGLKQVASKEFIPWSEIVVVGEHRILFGKTATLDERRLHE